MIFKSVLTPDIPLWEKDMYSKHMRVVGLQPFSRPGEQAGCVLRLGKKDDFRKKVLKKIKFRQDKDIRNSFTHFIRDRYNLSYNMGNWIHETNDDIKPLDMHAKPF